MGARAEAHSVPQNGLICSEDGRLLHVESLAPALPKLIRRAAQPKRTEVRLGFGQPFKGCSNGHFLPGSARSGVLAHGHSAFGTVVLHDLTDKL